MTSFAQGVRLVVQHLKALPNQETLRVERSLLERVTAWNKFGVLNVSPAETREKSARSTMAELRSVLRTCRRCERLVETRKQVVLGSGATRAPVMFLGYSPSFVDDQNDGPFSDSTGVLLRKIIQTMGLAVEETYLTYLLKCYGPNEATEAEIGHCAEHVAAEIDSVAPEVIVVLGEKVASALCGGRLPVPRGEWSEVRGFPIMVTHDPATLSTGDGRRKGEMWGDMLGVLEKLGRPINEQQKRYFRVRATV